jgi:hypothetical protein
MQEIRTDYLLLGTNAERLAFDISRVAEGKRWIETDTGYEYVKHNGAWHTPPTGGGGPHTHPESDITNLVTDLGGKAPSAQGVTNGNSHDHSGGDGGAIDHSGLGGVAATQHHTNANDPAAGEKAALAGTSGTPGAANKYVTNDDSRNTNARAPTAHNHPESEVTNLVTDLAAKEAAANKGAANGYPGLDINSRVPAAQLGSGTPDGTKFLRDDRTWTAPPGGSGGSELWEGRIHTNMLDGNPLSEPFMSAATNTTVSPAVTPTNIGIAVGRLVAFRFKTPITVATIRWYGIGAVADIYTAAIYRDSDNARLWFPGNISPTANAWGSNAAGGLPITFAADTLYWFGIGADSTGTTAGFVTPPVPRQQSLGLAAPAWAGLTTIGLRYCQVALTAGAWPVTLPTKVNAGAWTGFIPVFYLCASGF